MVSTYPSDTEQRDRIYAICWFTALFGIPIALTVVVWLLADSKHGPWILAISTTAYVYAMFCIPGWLNWRRMQRVLGTPFEVGERVEVISGHLAGKTGRIKFHGQGGPLSVFVTMDESDDETIVFKWHHLRRLQD